MPDNANDLSTTGLMSGDGAYVDVAQKVEPEVVVDTTLVGDNSHQGAGSDLTTSEDKTDWEKRYGDMRRYMSQKENEWKTQEADLRKQLTEARPKYTPPKTAEELETFKSENPDVYAVAETLAHMRVDSELKDVQDKISNLEKVELRAKKQTAMAELKVMHPDFAEIRATEEFHTWAKTQPSEIQGWLFNGYDAALASKAINLYKMERGSVQNDNNVKVDSSAADSVVTKQTVDTEGRQPKIWSSDEIAKMSLKDYEDNRAEIDLAFQEGRIR